MNNGIKSLSTALIAALTAVGTPWILVDRTPVEPIAPVRPANVCVVARRPVAPNQGIVDRSSAVQTPSISFSRQKSAQPAGQQGLNWGTQTQSPFIQKSVVTGRNSVQAPISHLGCDAFHSEGNYSKRGSISPKTMVAGSGSHYQPRIKQPKKSQNTASCDSITITNGQDSSLKPLIPLVNQATDPELLLETYGDDLDPAMSYDPESINEFAPEQGAETENRPETTPKTAIPGIPVPPAIPAPGLGGSTGPSASKATPGGPAKGMSGDNADDSFPFSAADFAHGGESTDKKPREERKRYGRNNARFIAGIKRKQEDEKQKNNRLDAEKRKFDKQNKQDFQDQVNKRKAELQAEQYQRGAEKFNKARQAIKDAKSIADKEAENARLLLAEKKESKEKRDQEKLQAEAEKRKLAQARKELEQAKKEIEAQEAEEQAKLEKLAEQAKLEREQEVKELKENKPVKKRLAQEEQARKQRLEDAARKRAEKKQLRNQARQERLAKEHERQARLKNATNKSLSQQEKALQAQTRQDLAAERTKIDAELAQETTQQILREEQARQKQLEQEKEAHELKQRQAQEKLEQEEQQKALERERYRDKLEEIKQKRLARQQADQEHLAQQQAAQQARQAQIAQERQTKRDALKQRQEERKQIKYNDNRAQFEQTIKNKSQQEKLKTQTAQAKALADQEAEIAKNTGFTQAIEKRKAELEKQVNEVAQRAEQTKKQELAELKERAPVTQRLTQLEEQAQQERIAKEREEQAQLEAIKERENKREIATEQVRDNFAQDAWKIQDEQDLISRLELVSERAKKDVLQTLNFGDAQKTENPFDVVEKSKGTSEPAGQVGPSTEQSFVADDIITAQYERGGDSAQAELAQRELELEALQEALAAHHRQIPESVDTPQVECQWTQEELEQFEQTLRQNIASQGHGQATVTLDPAFTQKLLREVQKRNGKGSAKSAPVPAAGSTVSLPSLQTTTQQPLPFDRDAVSAQLQQAQKAVQQQKQMRLPVGRPQGQSFAIPNQVNTPSVPIQHLNLSRTSIIPQQPLPQLQPQFNQGNHGKNINFSFRPQQQPQLPRQAVATPRMPQQLHTPTPPRVNMPRATNIGRSVSKIGKFIK
ncbi:MAG: hypothetical protein H6679_04825 [Epsilonproteobacteria bacterium]|nr:hypothetical protein [Campylobacterota bacterium]